MLSDYPERELKSASHPVNSQEKQQSWRPQRYRCKSKITKSNNSKSSSSTNSYTNSHQQQQTAIECLEKDHGIRQSHRLLRRDEPMNLSRLRFHRMNNRQMDTTIMVQPLPETVPHRNASAASASTTTGWKQAAAITVGPRIRTASGMGT